MRWLHGFRSLKRRRHLPCNPRLSLEFLEQRCLLTTPPAGTGPLPAVTVGLTERQADNADVVVDWNATMLRAIWADATPPTVASRVMALVGVAVYYAVDAIHPAFELYPVPGLTSSPPGNASPEAAGIAAADTVLSSLYPDQQALFATEYQATFSGLHGKARVANGLAWGQTVANAVLAWRSQDGSNASSNYTPAPPGGPPGVYELTPSAYKPALSPQWGQVSP
jgi:hypothetical protein